MGLFAFGVGSCSCLALCVMCPFKFNAGKNENNFCQKWVGCAKKGFFFKKVQNTGTCICNTKYSGLRLIGIRIKGIFGYLGFKLENCLLNSSK